MRLRRRAILAAIAVALLGAGAQAGERVVGLDRASLDALRRASPERWQKVQDILAAQRFIEDEALSGCLRANFGASEALRSGVVFTSLPPKRRLSFLLDGVRYEGLVPARFRSGTVRVSGDAPPDPCAPPESRVLTESELDELYERVE